MNERESLLRAICENPDEDMPRLVFADWLQENGQPERAEFIRLQVRFAALHRFAAGGADTVRKLERAIWAEHKEAFRSELPEVNGAAWFPEFHRGFVERLTISSDAELVRHADTIFNRVPVQHLEIRNFQAVEGFARLRYLRRLKTLSLNNLGADEAVVFRLMTCDQLNESVLLMVQFGGQDTQMYHELRAAFGVRLFRPHTPPPEQPPPPPTRRGRRRR